MPFPWWVIVIIAVGAIVVIALIVGIVILVVKLSESKSTTASAYNYHADMNTELLMENLYNVRGQEASMGKL